MAEITRPFKGKEIRFFEKIGFLNGLKISALQH
jgi:hypothetical protein